MQKILLKKWKEVVIVILVLANIFIFERAFLGGDKPLKITFFDVGQGDSVLIETPNNKQVIIDGGANKMALRNLSKVIPFYDKKIDAIFISHQDNDHSGGVFDILESFIVSNFFNSGLFDKKEADSGLQGLIEKFSVKETALREGDTIDLGADAFLEVLWPPVEIKDIGLKDTNDFSLVLRLVFGEGSFLFMGDAPQEVERYLFSKYGPMLNVDVLKVGHHGSKNSSSEEFLGAVSPEFSIISAGEDNSYGHPHKEVLDLLNKVGTNILETSKIGNISICSDGKTVSICEQ